MHARARGSPLLVYVILALLCAAALVVYLQHRALQALDRQTGLIVQKMAEQTALRVVDELRTTFEGPVFDTLAVVNHPVLRAGRFDLVAETFARGLRAYPQVESFFIWHERADRVAPGEALFYARKHGTAMPASLAPGFVRDPAVGREVLATAVADSRAQYIYAARKIESGGEPREIFLRIFYSDATRTRFFAVLGFVVNMARVREEVFAELASTRLHALLDGGSGAPRFELRVFDETGRLVHGPAGPMPGFSGRAPVPLVFYPEQDIGRRMAETVHSRPWSIALSPVRGAGGPDFASTETQGYWLSGLSVLLMFVALALVVHGQRRAAELARMQTDFVAQVSHQLKTPLAVLSAVTETLTLDRVRSAEKTSQYLSILRTETSRLAALVGRILEFARVEGRTPKYELEEVDLGALVQETIDAIGPGLERDGVTCRVQVEPPSPLVVADPVALEQVLLNLVDNAAKYSRPSREIGVRVRAVGHDARFEVADRGPGVPASERQRIFERFYRGSGAATSPNGFGLGLAIAAEIVRAHRGRIEVESAPGGGALFRVSLPLRERPVSAPEPSPPLTPARLRSRSL